VVDRAGGRRALRLMSGIAAAVLGLSVLATGQAGADQPKPTPGPGISPSATSSNDEITDMVMDAIEQNGSAAATSEVPAPPG
jgi:hypothetical protein